MASVFTLFGQLKADTSSFESSLRSAENRLRATEKAIDSTERKAAMLGKSNAVTARSFEKFNESVGKQRDKLHDAARAYQRGELSSKQMAKALVSVDHAADGVNSRLKDTNARLTDFGNRASRMPSMLQGIGQGMRDIGTSLTVGVTAPLTALGVVAFKQASAFDELRNRLTAATGSVDAGRQKFQELYKLAQNNAGVFTASAVDLYAFLRPLKLSDGLINNAIKAFGKLKLANKDLDIDKFGLNMTQLFKQGFERTDLKEAVGNFPRFGEIIQKAFSLSDSDLGTVASEMKDKLAKGLKFEDFFKGLVDQINSDPSLAGLGETIGTRMQKSMERIFLALEPLGKSIASTIEKILPTVLAVIERLSSAFNSLSPSLQGAVVGFGVLAAAAGPALIALGSIVSAIGTLAASASAIGIVSAAVVGLGIAIAPVVAYAAAFYAAWSTNFGGVRDIVDGVAQSVQRSWNDALTAMNALTAEVTAEISRFWAENGEDVKTALKAVSDAVKSIWGNLVAIWNEYGADIKEITSAVWEQVRTIVMTSLKVILEAIKLGAAIINGDWEKAWSAFGNIVSIAFKAAVKFIEMNMRLALAAVKGGFQAIWALSQWIGAEAGKLGLALGQGIINGLNSMAGAAYNAVSGWVSRNIIAPAAQTLLVRSPSKVFHGIGQDVAQGFIDGIESLKTSVHAAMVKLVDVTQIKGLTSKDSAGVQLLTSLIKELDNLAPRTKLQAVLAELTAGKYKAVNKELKEKILLLAKELDLLNQAKKITPGKERREEFSDFFRSGGFGEDQKGRTSTGTGPEVPVPDITGSILDIAYPPQIAAQWDSFWGTMRERMESFKNSLPSIKQALGENLTSTLLGIGDVLGNAVANWDGTLKGFWESLKSGFRQLIGQMIGELMRLIAVQLIAKALGAAFGGGASAGGPNIGSSLGASFPGGYAEGGKVRGPGSSTSDSILARLSDGEYVMSAKAVRKWGTGFFDRLNNASAPMAVAGMPGFAMGGYVGNTSTVNNNTTSPVFNISVSAGGGNAQQIAMTTKQAVREAIMMMEREQRRGR